MNSPFLRLVAQHYHNCGNVHDYCFVFPNHRSCKFFERELDITASSTYLMPEVKTITDFVTSLSGLVAVTPIDALFTLYKCYTGIEGNEQYPFDKFIYWGNVVLNDFNDVDMYLVNPKEIFTNVRQYRQLVANYIDEDLREIITRFFDISDDGPHHDDDLFWLSNYDTDTTDDGSVKGEFMRLWQSMYQLYQDYNNALAERGLSTMGNIYRKAVESVKEGNGIGNKRYVFVGFNMLSTSELAIFKRLSNRKVAQFFWDSSSPAFAEQYHDNMGGRMVRFYKKEFPQPVDFDPIDKFPSIEVVGIPSNAGQAQYAFNIINQLIKTGCMSSDGKAIDTAIVLPDEDLFVPLLNAVSNQIKNVNITMGYSLGNSDIASLMRVVAKMHHQARHNADTGWLYYREDVKTLLSHPIIKSCFGREALQTAQAITMQNLFMVPESMMAGTGLEPLFHSFESSQGKEGVIEFLSGLVDFCQKVKEMMPTISNENEETDKDTPRSLMTLQEAFLNQYNEVLNRLIDIITVHDVPQCESTVFMLIDRLAGVYSIPLEGEPLQGLQIMGLLETRCLDFDNVIILSANEHVLPRKLRTNTFITDFMRHNYGMSTTAHQEAMWSYYFYRLIGRASRLYMLYDTSTQALGSSEKSRYIEQLEKIYGCDVKHVRLKMEKPSNKSLTLTIPKKGEALDILRSFKLGGDRSLSASSINEYINCPLSFLFHYIEDMNADNLDIDFMDASTFGTIIHETLQKLYYPDENGIKRKDEYRVTCAMIKEFRKTQMKTIIARKVNEKYVRTHNLGAPLTGEAAIVSVAIEMFVDAALRYDINLLSNIDNNYLTVLECEHKHKNIPLNFGGTEFNFTYTADRIDRLSDGTLRMVDYKSGKDATDFKSMDDLFVKDDRRKAVLQLMLYCNAYAKETGYIGAIMPVIYTLRDMTKAGVLFDKKQLEDYRTINNDFTQRMGEVIEGFFDESKPFVQTSITATDKTPCRYCRFRDFCRR